MKVLYITGSCLQCNTSANMSHNSFVQGLIENNCQVDIIMSDPGLLTIDPNMPYWKEANYFVYKSVPQMDKLRLVARSLIDSKKTKRTSEEAVQKSIGTEGVVQQHNKLRNLLKYFYYHVLTKDSPHYLSRKWLKTASRYKSLSEYDLVISNSSPESSHALAEGLLGKKSISAKKWIQIWEDPWYYEFYSKQKEMILLEERRLLNLADEIYYVSPLTLSYQQQYFPEVSRKMKCLPLPFLTTRTNSKEKETTNNVVFGYFGDYYSRVRNLKPFYEASKGLDAHVYIYGDSDENFSETNNIRLSGRVDIGELDKVQESTDVLIHLCNLRGGQIPGKIYHYSGTDKPIIFILDGEEEEKRLLKEYFKKFNRYHFCDNTKESIRATMNKFIQGDLSKKSFIMQEFSPKQVVSELLNQ
jgi:hypothetical protein